MDNTTQNKAPDRIWIDPGSCLNCYGTSPDKIDPDETEYIRADLAQTRAIKFAEWIAWNAFEQCRKSGAWHNEYGNKLAESTADLYSMSQIG